MPRNAPLIPVSPARTPVSSELLSTRDVSRLLDCSVRHVRRLADSRRMPSPVRLGTLLRWRKSEIQAWVDGGCKPLSSAGAAS